MEKCKTTEKVGTGLKLVNKMLFNGHRRVFGELTLMGELGELFLQGLTVRGNTQYIMTDVG